MSAVSGSLGLRGRRFYLGAGAAALGLVFWGFARSYYLKLLFGSPELPVRLHIHGAVMTSWVVLFFIQTFLVARRRIDLHRRLGAFGSVIAVLVVVVGSLATLHAAAREVRGHTAQASLQVTILGLELVQMALFAGLVGAAIFWRRRAGVHKRLMLLGTCCMLPSAFSRIPLGFDGNFAILAMFDLFVAACILIDTLRNRRLHPAFAWGGALTLGALNLAYAGAYTLPWIHFATRLVS